MLNFGSEMEMKKLHMGTMSFGFDSMDEVAHQLATAFGASADQSEPMFASNVRAAQHYLQCMVGVVPSRLVFS
jgi:hypothetical protein